jgi:hypothetical protein
MLQLIILKSKNGAHAPTRILHRRDQRASHQEVTDIPPGSRHSIHGLQVQTTGTSDRNTSYICPRCRPYLAAKPHPLSRAVSAYQSMLAQIWVLSDPVPFSDRSGQDLGGQSTPRSGPCLATISPGGWNAVIYLSIYHPV